MLGRSAVLRETATRRRPPLLVGFAGQDVAIPNDKAAAGTVARRRVGRFSQMNKV